MRCSASTRSAWLLSVVSVLTPMALTPMAACGQDRAAAQQAVRVMSPIAPRVLGPDRWATEIAAAEASTRRGERRDATQRAARIAAAYEQGGARNSDEYLSAGRAYVLLGIGNAQAVRSALAAFDRATAADSNNFDAQRRAGELFLEKYNAPDARLSFEGILRRSPTDAKALLALARVEEFEGKGNPMATARLSIASDPRYADALAFVAKMHRDAEAYDSARVYAQRAIDADSTSTAGWSVLGSMAFLNGDSATFRKALAAVTAVQPALAEFYTDLAEASVRQRRYTESVALARRAIGYDSLYVPAYGVMGTNQLRIGQMAAGRTALERAFALDPFNLWHKNTLDLLDKMKSFRTIDRGRFRVVAPQEEADLLALYVVPLLEQAYDSLAVRYGYKPPTPIRLEFYRYHADFSVRTVGLAGLGALGVSFGSLLAMDTPNGRAKGDFNWGSTAWHELTHAFTLGASDHRVPRWLSEGLSVLEERRVGRGWGADATVSYVIAMANGKLRPISQLSDGFLRPRFPEETQFSYYQASLFCEMVEASRGAAALPAMLTAYRDGMDTPGVFQKVLGKTPAQIDVEFEAYTQRKFAQAISAVRGTSPNDSSGGKFVATMREAASKMGTDRNSARQLFEQARTMFPEYGGDDGPAWYLAEMAGAAGDTTLALTMVEQVTSRNETAWIANMFEANLREKRGDKGGAIRALDRLNWIWPYEPTVHTRLAALAASQGDHARAVLERRAIIAIGPTDLLDARYELARALRDAGDIAGARRELLQVLEEAPSFEKAQTLLLELRGK
ncbi:tetratricopeptide repeat protein [Gemmatimonas sp.]|uniref:tetratricopeptide repeat protein n=1 Tax=Gemmatimonas sp. TaxID=1962908 RepID=UPI003566A6EF